MGHILQDDAGIRADWTQVQKSMWAAFWSNSGSPKCRSFSSESRIKLLNRTVTCCFSWKIARWPFQKSVARELDSLQCRMYAFMLPCEPQMHETLDSFCRRRLRQARSVATKVGLWSLEWCERLCKWDQHLKRGERYGHICFLLNQHKSAEWLLYQRSNLVNIQNSISAGRTGTRLNCGKPQPRWSEGLPLARTIYEEQEGGKAQTVTISTRIRDALKFVRDNLLPSTSGIQVDPVLHDHAPQPTIDTEQNLHLQFDDDSQPLSSMSGNI